MYTLLICRLILTGYKKNLEPSDLPELNPQNTTNCNYPKFECVWNEILTEWRSTPAAREAECAIEITPLSQPALYIKAKAPIARKSKSLPLLSSNQVHIHLKNSTGENPKFARCNSEQTKEQMAETRRARKRAVTAWQKQEDADLKRYPSLFLALLRVFWPTILKAHLCKLAQDLVQYLNPFWLGYFQFSHKTKYNYKIVLKFALYTNCVLLVEC